MNRHSNNIKHMSYNGRKMEYAFNPVNPEDIIVFYNHEMYSYGKGYVVSHRLYNFISGLMQFEDFRNEHKAERFYNSEEMEIIKKAIK